MSAIKKDLEQAGDRLYSHFILRDVVAKVVPGAIILIAAGFLLRVDFSPLWSGEVSIWIMLLLAGVSWLVGGVAQELGTLFSLISVEHPEKRIIAFARHAGAAEKQVRERIVVIKQSSGNGAIAFLLLAVAHRVASPCPSWALTAILLFLAFCLLIKNGRSATGQLLIENDVLDGVDANLKSETLAPSVALALWRLSQRLRRKDPSETTV